MSWGGFGSIGSNLFSGGSGNFGQGSAGFDWGSLWGDIGQSGGTYSNWAGLIGDVAGSSGSGGGGWMDTIGGLFGGGGSGGQGGGSGIFSAMLGGLGGAAQAYLDKDAVEEAGKQQRRTIGYSADLQDYYKQRDKARKRTALDTFGQFSLMDRWAPNAVAPAPIDQPTKPTA